MTQGTIARIVADKGFGFIKRDGEDRDLFFHSNDTNGEFTNLNEGDKVSFNIEEGPKGLNAVDVVKA